MKVNPSIQSLSALYFFIIYLPMLPRAATIIFGTALRAAGDTKTPMRVGIGVNLINVILNFLLIFPTRDVTLGDWTVTLPRRGLHGGSLLFLFAPNMMTLFTKAPAVILLGATVLRMVAVSEPF